MIIIRYCGGLGNQMFQYAMQCAVESMAPNQEFGADIHHYNLLVEHNGFELERYFGIKFRYAAKRDIKKIYNGMIPGKIWSKIPSQICENMAHKYQFYYKRVKNIIFRERAGKEVTEDNYEFVKHDLLTGDWYMSGMWQRPEYWEDLIEVIKSKFTFNCQYTEIEQQIIDELGKGEAIAVHIRGGDFINQRFDLCDREYYSMALNQIGENLPVYVFTDDTHVVKKKLPEIEVKGIIAHPITESIKDMGMLTMSKYVIISNSTFSFWGAVLNSCYEKKIVCPQYARAENGIYVKSPRLSNWIVV